MKKLAVVTKVVIRDRIYIEKKDIEDIEYLKSIYTYFNGEEYLTTYEETENQILLPSNGFFKLKWDKLIDSRNFEKLPYQLPFSGTLREEQEEVVDKFTAKGRAISGVIQAPCGFGKTYTSCSLIAKNNTKTLILVHTKLLFKQWVKELEQLLPGCKIGQVGDGLFDLQDITVAIYKTVFNRINDIREHASLIIVDEAHMCPADTFSFVLNNLNAKIKIGVSATPRRKDGKHVFFKDFFSPFIVVAKDSRILATPSVKVMQTDIPFRVRNPKLDWAKGVTKLSQDKNYLQLIANTAINDIKNNRRPLILSDRVQMLKDLQLMIPNGVCLLGESKEEVREEVLENVGAKYHAVLSTKLFDEGISCHRLDTLYLTCPSANTIKLEQRIGRIIREHPDSQPPLIRDFWLKGLFTNRQQLSRMDWYRKNGYNIL